MNTMPSENDLPAFLADLQQGLPIRLLIAPAALQALGDFPQVLGYLRSLGVKAFHPVLPYADITVWVYYQFLKKNPDKPLITSACVGMNRYLSRNHTELGAYSPPVFSPLLCGARYLRKYRRIQDRLAFLSPCGIKWKEFTLENQENLIQYHVPIDAFDAWLENQGIHLSQYDSCSTEPEINGDGLTVAAFGGIGKTLSALVDGLDCRMEQGLENAAAYLRAKDAFAENCRGALVFEPYACAGGCSQGSRVGKKSRAQEKSLAGNFLQTKNAGDINRLVELFSYYDKTLDMADFCHPVPAV
jgi:iron only hydrogenase large subunit-like protein